MLPYLLTGLKPSSYCIYRLCPHKDTLGLIGTNVGFYGERTLFGQRARCRCSNAQRCAEKPDGFFWKLPACAEFALGSLGCIISVMLWWATICGSALKNLSPLKFFSTQVKRLVPKYRFVRDCGIGYMIPQYSTIGGIIPLLVRVYVAALAMKDGLVDSLSGLPLLSLARASRSPTNVAHDDTLPVRASRSLASVRASRSPTDFDQAENDSVRASSSPKVSVFAEIPGINALNGFRFSVISVVDLREQLRQALCRDHFLLSGNTRGRWRILSHDDELYDGMTVKVAPLGRGGMRGGKDTSPDPLSGKPTSPRKIDRPRSGSPADFVLKETPSPGVERVQKPTTRIPRPIGTSSLRTTAASETSQVRFTNVSELESRLSLAEARARESAERTEILERKLGDTLRQLSKEREEHASKERVEPRQGVWDESTESPETKPKRHHLPFNDEDDGQRPGVEAKAYLGQNPPTLEKLPDMSGKPIAERIACLVRWLERLKAWVESTCDKGTPLFHKIRECADEYYVHWLNASSSPLQLAELTFADIREPDEHEFDVLYTDFLTRSFSRINEKLPTILLDELLEEISLEDLSPFQKVTGVVATVLINVGVTNLEEHTKLFTNLHSPVAWLGGVHTPGQSGWQGLAEYNRILKFATQLPQATGLDCGKLNLGLRTLLDVIFENVGKMEADELSEKVRGSGLYAYTSDIDSLLGIVKLCRGFTRASITFNKNWAQKEKEKKAKQDKKAEENKKKQAAAAAAAAPGKTPKGGPKGSPKGAPKGAPKGTPKGAPKGSGGDGQAAPKQAAQPRLTAAFDEAKRTDGKTPKGHCYVCKEPRNHANHPDGKFCIALCWECGEQLDHPNHPNKVWCPSKNGTSPARPGQPHSP